MTQRKISPEYFRALEELEAKSPYPNPTANPIVNPIVNSTINVNSPLNPHTNPHITELDINILSLMAGNPKVTVTALSEKLNKDRSTLRDHIKM